MRAIIILSIILFTACAQTPKKEKESATKEISESTYIIKVNSPEISLNITETGRYTVHFYGNSDSNGSVWLEDYIQNNDGRTYNVTGSISLINGVGKVDGSPLAAGKHNMKIHTEGKIQIDSISLTLLKPHIETANSLTQSMDGDEWELVWSDEFEADGLPDSTKWSYNIGNWGWGNNELQYYTENKLENARQEGGNLIIEAHNQHDGSWTSARLTTQGKVSFLYGKIEFRAKVPEGRGTWAAGWLLGDEYRDEISWPYCGEIDVLECVGFEIDDNSGKGMNHASCHTRAYYFKQGNQITSTIGLDSMNTQFHTYAVEWYPTEVRAYLDGEHYYTYDKTANELEWPFNKAQNIIVNLAVGGGWGGAKGVDESYDSHQYIIDYIRVYGK